MAKTAIFVIAQNNFRDEELLKPKEVLTRRGVTVKIASRTRNKALGKLGTEIQPDLALVEIKADTFDAIIFVGGSGASEYLVDPQVHQLANDFNRLKKIIGGICLGPSILANAGILIGKTVTAFPSQEQNLRDKGADYTGMQVEIDGNIVTAKDPTAAQEFGEKLAYLLEG
jgi:protease I